MLKKYLTLQIMKYRPLSMSKNKRVIRVMKGELGGQIMKKILRLRPKTYSHLKDSNDECKKAKVKKNGS